MNWHFLFFLFDVIIWVFFAAFFHKTCISENRKLKNKPKYRSTIGMAFFAGLVSIVQHGLPDIGLSFISFIYVVMACLGVIFYAISKNSILQKMHMQMGSRIMKSRI
ncbi:MAG TPA: hypothetical protein VEW42_05775 [Candidatus Eisenbacteria bacterium]|nr:hypothetical protein [Candidatus Eisenbacteria bacterium]